MGILSWIILGLIAGSLAKLAMPGKDPGGLIITMLLGIGGAFVGGYLGSLVGQGGVSDLGITSILTAVVGAIVLLAIYRLLKK